MKLKSSQKVLSCHSTNPGLEPLRLQTNIGTHRDVQGPELLNGWAVYICKTYLGFVGYLAQQYRSSLTYFLLAYSNLSIFLHFQQPPEPVPHLKKCVIYGHRYIVHGPVILVRCAPHLPGSLSRISENMMNFTCPFIPFQIQNVLNNTPN